MEGPHPVTSQSLASDRSQQHPTQHRYAETVPGAVLVTPRISSVSVGSPSPVHSRPTSGPSVATAGVPNMNAGFNPYMNPAASMDNPPQQSNLVPLSNQQQTGQAPYPLDSIPYPGINDVMCGRGGGANNHIGNIRFRQLVQEHKLRYLAAAKSEKPRIAREIVVTWRSMDPPGRFLTRTDPDKLGDASPWHDIGDRKARDKASQCLRERTQEEKLNQAENAANMSEGGMTSEQKLDQIRKLKAAAERERAALMAALARSAATSTEARSRTPDLDSALTGLNMPNEGVNGANHSMPPSPAPAVPYLVSPTPSGAGFNGGIGAAPPLTLSGPTIGATPGGAGVNGGMSAAPALTMGGPAIGAPAMGEVEECRLREAIEASMRGQREAIEEQVRHMKEASGGPGADRQQSPGPQSFQQQQLQQQQLRQEEEFRRFEAQRELQRRSAFEEQNRQRRVKFGHDNSQEGRQILTNNGEHIGHGFAPAFTGQEQQQAEGSRMSASLGNSIEEVLCAFVDKDGQGEGNNRMDGVSEDPLSPRKRACERVDESVRFDGGRASRTTKAPAIASRQQSEATAVAGNLSGVEAPHSPLTPNSPHARFSEPTSPDMQTLIRGGDTFDRSDQLETMSATSWIKSFRSVESGASENTMTFMSPGNSLKNIMEEEELDFNRDNVQFERKEESTRPTAHEPHHPGRGHSFASQGTAPLSNISYGGKVPTLSSPSSGSGGSRKGFGSEGRPSLLTINKKNSSGTVSAVSAQSRSQKMRHVKSPQYADSNLSMLSDLTDLASVKSSMRSMMNVSMASEMTDLSESLSALDLSVPFKVRPSHAEGEIAQSSRALDLAIME